MATATEATGTGSAADSLILAKIGRSTSTVTRGKSSTTVVSGRTSRATVGHDAGVWSFGWVGPYPDGGIFDEFAAYDEALSFDFGF